MKTIVISTENMKKIVIQHAAAAGVSAMAACVVPGVAAIAAGGISVAAIWGMYVRIAHELNVKLSKNVWKVVASAVLTNIVTQMAGILALEFAMSLVPGASVIAGGLVNFGVTYAAGLLFMSVMTNLFNAGMNPDEMSAEQMKEIFHTAAHEMDMKAAFEEGKEAFKAMRKDGSLEAASRNVQMNVE